MFATFDVKQTKFELFFTRKCLKHLKKPRKCNLGRNVKDMTIVFDYNLFNTITYTKKCCVPCFLANTPRLNHF